MCFGCSKEPSNGDGSFEYPQHMFCMRNKENIHPICTLIWRPDNEGQLQVNRLPVFYKTRIQISEHSEHKL